MIDCKPVSGNELKHSGRFSAAGEPPARAPLTDEIVVSEIERRYGKPFDYFRLGKSFRGGEEFMLHMKRQGEELWNLAERQGAVRPVANCPVCGAAGAREILRFLGFPYSQCPDAGCRHVFVSSLINEAVRNEFFAKDNEYSRFNYCDPKKSAFRIKHIAEPKVDYALRYAGSKAKSWLDVGCGSGEILSVVQRRSGWKALGLELSRIDAAFARDFYRVDVREQTLEAYRKENPDARHDVVSMFGVLHCVPDPASLMRQAAGLLSEDGVLVAEVTHYDSVLSAAVRTFPSHPTRSSYNGVTTLHQFTEESIRRVFAASGLKPVAVWHYGTDIFELLNQWCFSDPAFADSALYQELLPLANDIQLAMDAKRRSSAMLWVARCGK